MKSIIILILSVKFCFCEDPQKPTKNAPADDIQINADSMDYDTSQKHAQAKGNVTLSYKLKGLPIKLKADALQAQFDEHGKLLHAFAEGNVEIDYDKTILHATKCEHDFNKNKAICTGEEVKLIQRNDGQNNEMLGKEATLDFPAQVFKMHSTGQEQISCVVYPKQKEKNHKNP